MTGLSLPLLLGLAFLGLLGGVGITAIGPGGVLPTVGLFALTDLSPAQVAGTAIVTHVATGVVGTAAYARSGQLRERRTQRIALILAGAAVIGAPFGVLINGLVSKRLFGILLGVLVAVVAALVLYRERHRAPSSEESVSEESVSEESVSEESVSEESVSGTAASRPQLSVAVLSGLGLIVAIAAGIVGIGGPMLTVPLLVAAGVPVLESLAAAQVQSIVIAGAGTVGYLATGAIDWPLAAVIGVPELAGVLIGWKIARALPTHQLKYALIVALFALAPYLALHG